MTTAATTGPPRSPSPADLATVPAPRDGRVRTRARRLTGVAVLLGALAALCLASLAVGAKPIPLGTVARALADAATGTAASTTDALVVTGLRAPRTVVGLLVGAALGVAGALMQALTRNPLADPGILGVNAGAAFAVVLALSLLGVGSLLGLAWFAMAGAAGASVLVFLLGTAGRGGASAVRLTLAGAALTALLGSLTGAVVLLDRATLDTFRFWQVGSLAGRDLSVVTQLGPFVAAGLLLALALARPLNAVALGDEAAAALGTRLGRTRALAALAVVLLCGSATAAAGPIVFVGLVVPHVVRMVVGPDQRWLLPACAVAGPVVLLLGDVLGRVLARPGEVQVGIMTALIGGPVFVALVRRTRLAAL